MIPKIIHLCWFSGDKYPEDIQFCINSWKKVLPDFQIKVWTKEMALATGIDWAREAISVKKWAFAADVIRLYAVYHDGGVYMDSDIYVQKRFDEFMEKRCAFFQEYHPTMDITQYVDENGNRRSGVPFVRGCMGIQAALFMSEPGNVWIKKLLDDYKDKHFISEDGSYSMTALAPDLYALNAEKFGYKYRNVEQHLTEDLVVFPSIYVGSTISLRTEKSFAVHCIHHGWDEDFQNLKYRKDPLIVKFKVFIYHLYCRLIGKSYRKEPRTFKDKLEAWPMVNSKELL